jgi:preprotein translocase subunit SecG
MLQSIVLIAHVAIALLIIGLVLLQRGKGAEAGTGFGAGASGTVFGARGSANFLSRTTGVLATLFFVTSLALAYLGTQRGSEPDSLLERATLAPATRPSSEPSVAPAASDLPELPAEPAPEASELPELPASDEPGAAGESN